jgi:pimeloyl-ACP methyl ester carboxylesterase
MSPSAGSARKGRSSPRDFDIPIMMPFRGPRVYAMRELDLDRGDGRTLHAYDTNPGDSDRLPVFWLHGTPNIGSPPEPLFDAADRLGIRWVSYDRPGYGGSPPRPGRDFASGAGDVAAVADALSLDRFAVLGHSSGGPHALACGALLPDRVRAVVSVSGLAPYGADGLDWFGGMAPAGVASLEAALAGREAKQRYEASATDDDPGFVPADHAALEGDWSWFISVVRPALAGGPDGLIDDELANVGPWGFDPAEVQVPTLLMHGALDRMVPCSHSEWLVGRCPTAELRLVPDDGHVSVLRHAPAALEWLRSHS